MAQTIWQAASQGNFGTSANWTNGVPGAASGKVGIFDVTSQTSVSAGLDRGLSAFPFRIRTTRTYFGNVGGPGNPLVIRQLSGELCATIRGPGETYLSFGDAIVSNAVIVDCENGFCNLSENPGVSAGTNPLMVKSGRVEVNGNIFGKRFMMDVGGNARVVFENVNLPEVTEIGGGTLEIKSSSAFVGSDPKVFSMNGGTVICNAVLATKVRVTMHGGHFRYNPGTSPSGETPDLTILGGFFDASDFPGDLTLGKVILGRTGRISENIQADNLVDFDLGKQWP